MASETLEQPAVEQQESAELITIRNKWWLVHEELKQSRNAHIQAVLVDTEPSAFGDGVLSIRFPYQTMADVFSKRMREFGPATAAAIQKVTGIACEIRTVYAHPCEQNRKRGSRQKSIDPETADLRARLEAAEARCDEIEGQRQELADALRIERSERAIANQYRAGALRQLEQERARWQEALDQCPGCAGKGFIEQRWGGCRSCGRQLPQTMPNREGLNLVPCEMCKPYRAALAATPGEALAEVRREERERCIAILEAEFAKLDQYDGCTFYVVEGTIDAIRALPAEAAPEGGGA